MSYLALETTKVPVEYVNSAEKVAEVMAEALRIENELGACFVTFIYICCWRRLGIC